MMDALKIIDEFYPQSTPLKELLLRHSMQVRDKALDILHGFPQADIAEEEVVAAALLHDLGIFRCHAPSIFCEGDEPYICHGIIGAALLREYGAAHGMDLERYARVCERHTGSGLSTQEIREQKLPLPERDFLPETGLEKLICLADKFYSKSGNLQEKPLDKVRRSMGKFGFGSLERFEKLLAEFHYGMHDPVCR